MLHRQLEPEIMDDPQLEASRHVGALRGLSRINWLSNSVGHVWGPIAKLAKEKQLTKVRVLDIATGGGDIPLGLWRKAERAPFEVDVVGVDISSRALEFARAKAKEAGAKAQFETFNALDDSLPDDFDVIVASLFLHHLTDEQALQLLTNMRQATRRLVVINDLLRSRRGLFLAHVASRLFTRSDVVRVDGPLSVKAAFTLAEVSTMAKAAGLTGAQLSRRWPCRFLLQWQKP